MKFTVQSSELYDHLAPLSRVISAKTTIPALECFLFEVKEGRLHITASDSETTLKTALEITNSDMDGTFALSGRSLLDALKEFPDLPLNFDVNTENLEIVVNYINGQCVMMGSSAEEYPTFSLPEGEGTVTMNIKTKVLREGINRTLFAAGVDELRPVMQGIFFDATDSDLTMVASDGRKLVRFISKEVSAPEKLSFILPQRPANLLKTLTKDEGEATLHLGPRNAVFCFGHYELYCRLIEGRFPNYNAVIPTDNPYSLTVDRVSMISALKRVLAFAATSSASLLKMKIEHSRIELSAQDLEASLSAKETLNCSYEGEPVEIGFNGTYLVEAFSNIADENAVMKLADPSRACVITPAKENENEDLLVLVMPMLLMN